MSSLSRFLSLITACSVFIITGCSSTQPLRYSGIESASQLKKNDSDNADRIPYRYSTAVNWNKYSSFVLDPVSIYNGADHQFGDIPESDRLELARYMQLHLSQMLMKRFQQANAITPNTLRIKVTLTGAATTTQFAGTITKFDLAGGPYNIVQSIRGKEGMLNGSVSFAVEIYDASTKRLLHAYVAKQYPNAMNISASIGALSAAKVGIEKGVDELMEIFQ